MCCIGIVGLGHIGSLLASKIGRHQLIIVSRNIDKSWVLAGKAGATLTSDLNLLRFTDVVFLTLPSDVTADMAKKLDSILNEDAVIVNLATSVSLDDLKKAVAPTRQLVSATIVGSAPGIAKGENTVVILSPLTEQALFKVMPLFAGFASVSVGDENLGKAINTIAAREAIRTYAKVKEELERIGVCEELIQVALSNVCAGTLQAVSKGNLGAFGQAVLEDIQRESK
ncbi:MAG: prephenate dehydrogenase/arogenate dehydrogenase family protein [Dethiobacter sp.]|nr:prephenate dehydrogenase/arogenate dehydrogenase family protein [Dethiobacter sp.]